MSGTMDFSTPPVPAIKFTVDGDDFFAAGECPGGTITDLAAVSAAEGENEAEQLQVAMQFFDQVLLPESAELFADRLRDPRRPISLPKAMQIFTWLMGKYSDFPTEEPASLQAGSPATGKSSAARSSAKAGTTRTGRTPRSAAASPPR